MNHVAGKPAVALAGAGADRPAAGVKTVNRALQGGGAHRALVRGVLDRLLEDGRVALERIAATSAGVMNAVVLAYELAEGGHDGARTALADFWRRISGAAVPSPPQPSPLDRLARNHALEWTPIFQMFDLMPRVSCRLEVPRLPARRRPRLGQVSSVDLDRHYP